MFSGTNDVIDVGDPAKQRAAPDPGQRNDQDFGGFIREPVDMTFVRLVNEHITRSDAMTTRVAGFHIVSGQHERCERTGVLVTRKNFLWRVIRTGHARMGRRRHRHGIQNWNYPPQRELRSRLRLALLLEFRH